MTIHCPTPEPPITMLACARLGLVHFGCLRRIQRRRLVAGGGLRQPRWCTDGYYRAGKIVIKPSADIAVDTAAKEGHKVEKVLAWRRYQAGIFGDAHGAGPRLLHGRRIEAVKRVKIDPVSMEAEDPLFLMYTSGTTGKPKGCQHRTGG